MSRVPCESMLAAEKPLDYLRMHLYSGQGTGIQGEYCRSHISGQFNAGSGVKNNTYSHGGKRMFRKLALVAAFALPLTAVANGGSFAGTAAHAATINNTGTVVAGSTCTTSYPQYPYSAQLTFCNDDVGFDDDTGANDNATPYSNQAFTVSLRGFQCELASVTTGQEYYTNNSSEYDTYNYRTNRTLFHVSCQVQTGDTAANGNAPTSNAFAYVYYTDCESYNYGDQYLRPGNRNAIAYESESTSGVVTLQCNYSEYGNYV